MKPNRRHGAATGHNVAFGVRPARSETNPQLSPDEARAIAYERADVTSNTYYDWLLDHAFILVPAQDYVGQFLVTFRDYPQRQKAANFNMDEVLAKLKEGSGSK